MKHHKLKCMTTFWVSFGFLGSPGLALQTYPLVDHQSTTVTISQTEQNRIAVLGDRIQQVFGADGTFDVQTDEEGGQIFLIMPKAGLAHSAVIKPMTITLITEEGLTQDLKLIPKDIEAQSILLKPMLSLTEEPSRVSSQETHLQQVINLLKAMVKNEELEGYTKTFPKKDSLESTPLLNVSFKSTLKFDPIVTYTASAYEGQVFSLTTKVGCRPKVQLTPPR